MTDEQNKGVPGERRDKALARRDRQAQALRQNLARRKAQQRGRLHEDAPKSAVDEDSDEPPPG